MFGVGKKAISRGFSDSPEGGSDPLRMFADMVIGREREMKDVPEMDDPEVEEARRSQRRRYGRAATLLTGGRGLTEPAPTARRTLLGI